ncbi:hypothetical protein RU97_GL001711 [Enterococcus canis]|uniref:Uncharacterized protein n=1 Tax=Enterococcus canis TaxID=214095 RepID=A0A1L8RF05_9ENTE|nr:hypothetical protein [Enterococcus canis]OJG18314.1 hypothetical protein RU97_GL001711 [Enterococcus canis]
MKPEEKFLTFILERTKPEKQTEMKQLLAQAFEKKQTGHLNKLEVMGMIPKAISYLQPEKVAEVKQVMEEFASKR